MRVFDMSTSLYNINVDMAPSDKNDFIFDVELSECVVDDTRLYVTFRLSNTSSKSNERAQKVYDSERKGMAKNLAIFEVPFENLLTIKMMKTIMNMIALKNFNYPLRCFAVQNNL